MMLSMAFSDVKKFLPRLPGRRTILVGWAMLVFAVLIILWQMEQEALVQVIIAVILGGLGLYFARRQTRATEKSTRVAQDNVRVAQEGQVTERFTRANEQLGHEQMEIRLSGIYALERLAKDSEKYHGPVMEVLTAYVREKAPRQTKTQRTLTEKPPADIQAILTVIGRRETTGNNRHNAPLNLSESELVGANLIGANLVEANLTNAHLVQARLWRADLNRAFPAAADLSGAFLVSLDEAEDAKNLTVGQVKLAKNWEEAYLPDYLNLPKPPAA